MHTQLVFLLQSTSFVPWINTCSRLPLTSSFFSRFYQRNNIISAGVSSSSWPVFVLWTDCDMQCWLFRVTSHWAPILSEHFGYSVFSYYETDNQVDPVLLYVIRPRLSNSIHLQIRFFCVTFSMLLWRFLAGLGSFSSLTYPDLHGQSTLC